MTRLAAKIVVERLDEERYARVENRLMAAYRSGLLGAAPRPPASFGWRRLAPLLAAGAVALVLLAYLGARWLDHGRAPVAETPAPRARLSTDARGLTHYQIGAADIAVAPDATVEVRLEPSAERPGHEVHVDLVAGTIDCEVEPIPERAPFMVHAGGIDVSVVGTAFRVQRDDRVRVSVTRGKVRVDGPDGPRFLGPGESFESQVLVAENRATAGAGPAARKTRGASGEPGADSSDDHGAGAARSAEPGALDGRGPATLPDIAEDSRALAPRSAHAPDAPTASGKDSADARKKADGAAPRTRSGSDKKRAGAHTPRQRELRDARPARGQPPSRFAEFAELLELEERDPRAAVERYGDLSLGRGAEAEFALYSKAYVQHLTLGHSSAALITLRHYQKRFPRGAHSESAQWLRIHILCQQTDLDKCRAAAHSYLSQYKSGQYRDLAGRIINWGM